MAVSDDDFKKMLRESPEQKKVFNDRIASNELIGMNRPEAYAEAKEYIVGVITGERVSDSPVEDYMAREFGPSKDLRADTMWVNDNRSGRVDWDTCPSNGARNMFHDFQTVRGFKSDFVRTYLPKVLPTGSERDELLRKEDDGRDLTGLNDKLSRLHLDSLVKAKELVEASGVSWSDD